MRLEYQVFEAYREAIQTCKDLKSADNIALELMSLIRSDNAHKAGLPLKDSLKHWYNVLEGLKDCLRTDNKRQLVLNQRFKALKQPLKT